MKYLISACLANGFFTLHQKIEFKAGYSLIATLPTDNANVLYHHHLTSQNYVLYERNLVSFLPVIPTNVICTPLIKRTKETINNNKTKPNSGRENTISATAIHMTPVPTVKIFEALL